MDGSCLAKFVLPKKKAICPKLSIDNGEIFLIGSGRMVQFYCDTGYVRVPDTEVAICQVQGTWSKMVPVLVSGIYIYYTGYVRVPDSEVAICHVQGTWRKMVPVCLKPGCQVIIYIILAM